MTVPAPSDVSRRSWRTDAGVLATLAVLLRLPAFFADAHLTYDDGVFGSSALLMRAGELPFRQIFSPQGPLFLPLVELADLLGLRTANAPRLLPVVSAAVATVAVYAGARYLTTRGGALLAAVLVTTSGSVLWATAPITSDGPALALATTAFALALGYRAHPSTGRAVAVGFAMGAALCIKVLVLPAALPVGLLLLSRRRRRDLALAIGVAGALAVAVTLPWGFDRVWDQYIAYHRDSARIASHAGAARKLVTTLLERDSLVVVAGALAVGAAFWRRSSGRVGARGPLTFAHRRAVFMSAAPLPAPTAAGLLSLWAGGVAAVLILEPAFWRPQLSELIPPLALLVALRPPPLAALGVAAILVAPWYLAHVNPMLWPDRYDQAERAAVASLRALPEGAQVITDDPGLAWRADHVVPGPLVDASIKRIEQGQITAASLARAARDDEVCAVLVWSNRYGEELPSLPRRLRAEGYDVAARFGDERLLYEREECEP